MKLVFYHFFLWCSVLTLGLWVGGTLFHMAVVEPMWSYDPPSSVRFFFTQTRFNTTIWNFFGPPWMATRLIPLLLCVPLGWNIAGEQRIYLLIAAACWIFITIYTLVYIYPINDVLFIKAGGDHSAEYINRLASKWLRADRFRFIIGTIGYVCLLIVFRGRK